MHDGFNKNDDDCSVKALMPIIAYAKGKHTSKIGYGLNGFLSLSFNPDVNYKSDVMINLVIFTVLVEDEFRS